MPRYIDADALKAVLTLPKESKEMGELLTIIIHQTIDEQPTVDVVEVVRCKDCGYYKSIKRTDRHQCVNDFVAEIETKPDDFCSRAERRTDEIN